MSLTLLLRSEYLRYRTLRSNLFTVLASTVAVVVMAYFIARSFDGGAADTIVAEPVALPMEYFAYVVMILGVLAVTSDLETGTAVVAACLVADRVRVLAGKFLWVAGLGLATAVPALVLIVLAGTIGGDSSLSGVLGADGVARSLAADVLAVPLAALLGAAVAVVLRSTALTISLLLLWSLAVETVLVFVVDERYGAFLPFKTLGGSRVAMDQLGPLEGVGVFAAYVLVAVALAVAVTVKRDYALR